MSTSNRKLLSLARPLLLSILSTAITAFPLTPSVAGVRCEAVFKHKNVEIFPALAQFEEKGPDLYRRFFGGITSVKDLVHGERPAWHRIGRFFPMTEYFKHLLSNGWGEVLDVPYGKLKEKVRAQPYVKIKRDGSIELHRSGGNAKWLELAFPGPAPILHRGQNVEQALAIRYLHEFYHGRPVEELRTKFFEEIAIDAGIKKEFDQRMWGYLTAETANRVDLAENPKWRAMSDSELASYLRQNFLSADYLFFSSSFEGGDHFRQVKPRRVTSSYRFRKDAFLEAVGPSYRQAIHAGSERLGAIGHWEIAFPVAESEATVRKLIMALEPIGETSP